MYEQELEVAIESVRQASHLCQHIRATLVTDETITKQDRSPVTIADLAGQAVMSHLLQEAFPADPLVAEEDTALLQEDEHSENRQRVLEQVRRACMWSAAPVACARACLAGLPCSFG